MSNDYFPTLTWGAPGGSGGSHGKYFPDLPDLKTPSTGGNNYFPKPPDLKSDYAGYGNSPSPGDAPVKGTRTDADLKIPPTEDSTHKDITVDLGNGNSMLLRWSADLGYVAIGEKKGGGDMHMYTEQEFKTANAGQSNAYGGGPIPPADSKHPEIYVPPEGNYSLIYRYDPTSGKEQIVGVRSNGQRSYFQSTATMQTVNKFADSVGSKPPDLPLAMPGALPPGGKANDGHLQQYNTAKNNDGKTYIWRWDSTAGRYCAVAESTDKKGEFKWYSEDEYKGKNSGTNALVMNGGDAPAPVRDPGQPEEVTSGGQQIHYFSDDPAGTEKGDGVEVWGQPIYITDQNTGHKVCIGVQVTDHDGNKTDYYFDKDFMDRYNNTETINGKTYYIAKDPKDWAKNDHRDYKAPPDPNANNNNNNSTGTHGGCVHVDSLLPDGRRARDIQVGDVIQLGDESTELLETRVGMVTYSKTKLARGFRITTRSGITLLCSETAPIWTDEGFLFAPDLLGKKIATRVDDKDIVTRFETVEVLEEIGMIEVQHITVGDRAFWAGAKQGAYILHHNKPMDF